MLKSFINKSTLAGIICLLVIANSCKEESSDRVLAEAYGQKLYLSEIDELTNDDLSYEDSVFLLREFINSWIREQVVLHESSSVLKADEMDKSKQLEAYRNDLLVYETLNKLAIQRMDSSFSEEEFLEYYEANQKEFELGENIIKLVFFKLPQQLEDIDQLWGDFKSSECDLLEFKELCIEHGGNYSIDSASWVFFDDILKEIPINTYNQEHYLNNNKTIKIKEGQAVYFVKILDFRIKSGISPFEMEKERIRKILFVQRQQTYLKSVETELVDKAYNNNKIVIH
ncbi:MAG: hypothetical protein JXR19_07900 [Bacteroidia bacterium]